MDDGDNALEFFRCNFTSSVDVKGNVSGVHKLGRVPGVRHGVPLVQIHIGLFAHQVGVTASDTLYLGEGVHDLLLAIDVGVEETKDKLEVRLLSRDERYKKLASSFS